MIRLEHVSFAYPDQGPAVKDISFHAEKANSSQFWVPTAPEKPRQSVWLTDSSAPRKDGC